jgi:uroporphyrinogen decarboxylase
METRGTSLAGCATDGAAMVGDANEAGPSLTGLSFSNLEWVKENAADLCAMGWADVAFFHNSWMDVLMEAMVTHPETVDRWMQVNLRQVLLQLEAQLERGVDLILGGQDFCDTAGPMFSPGHYERFIQPSLRAITEMCHKHGVPYLRHEDGSLGPIERQFLLQSGIDGWHAIEPVAGMDIFYFKENYGDKITLAGNIDCGETLCHGTPKQIREEVRSTIQRCAPGGGYIVSSSNTIHADVPGRNYLIMREAAEEFGRYPICS